MAHRLIRAVTLVVLGVVLTASTRAQDKPVGPSAADAEVVKAIDSKLAASWQENKVKESPLCTDHEFLRRATLDIVGRIATYKEIEDYIKDLPGVRRARLVERLLKSDEYPKHWANLWANWLLTRSGPFGRGKYHDELTVWLEDQFATNKSMGELATALITASGPSKENPAVHFTLAHLGEPVAMEVRNPREKREAVEKDGHFEMVPLTSRISRLFLGIQTQCTQCHDHPFDNKLKQTDFWGINAFLRQVQRRGGAPVGMGRMMSFPDLTLEDDPAVNVDAVVSFEKRNGGFVSTKATFLGGSKLGNAEGGKAVGGKARREELARLIVAHDNFARALVNRMWGHFFGRGIVHPIDDFTEQNAPSQPEVLDELAAQFRHYGLDQKKLIRWLANSKAYQLSSVANKTNDKADQEGLFSRMLLKAMSPEQLSDSLWVATQPLDKEKTNKASKVEQRKRWLDALIGNFGDDEGNEVTFNGTIVQALMMMNGGDLNGALKTTDGAVNAVVTKNKGNQDGVINDLFLLALNRRPNPTELANVKKGLPFTDRRVRNDTPLAAYQDLLWALLNSNEFMLNH